ncbi:Pentatricopeptide repeat-containing protein [Camellia lanceoleosa]|uniref:Pentatricopeptide repeat-containing protein n=1 Tax=Camellia lanceoleosa TaxID=1840588 RepID=A0ACC0HLS7_9ERIC|nr:Pentatricopeptide repeat-containing protein [Camellia lanceoleosa]
MDPTSLDFQEALSLITEGTSVESSIYVPLLQECIERNSVSEAQVIHGHIVKIGTHEDLFLMTFLVNVYAKCEAMENARKLAFRVFIEMLEVGAYPTNYTLGVVLNACCLMYAIGLGKQIHSCIVKYDIEYDTSVGNALGSLYSNCGNLNSAVKAFLKIREKNVISWTTVISSCGDNRDSGMGLRFFGKMLSEGVGPNEFTLTSILSLCCVMQALSVGSQTIKTGFLSDVVVGTALVNMYNKCGSIERASKAFVEMSTRTLISWTSMITGFAQHGCLQQTLQLFEDMRLVGVRPNKITFVGVLSACSHAGMVDEALAYFEMMKNEHKIKPVMDHFACVIDIFVRLGCLDEAFEIIKKMDFEPNEFIWYTMIAGSRSHKNLELGFYAAELLLKLNPKNSETYVLLLNTYISAGRWQDVSRVRKLMKDEKIGKLKDWSWISIKDKVYSFKPDFQFRPQCEEADQLLADLIEKAKNHGYEPQGDLGVTDEQDEETTFSTIHHSEKLAVTFGLLNTSNAVPIHVIKSTSMCQDCHSFIKFVSILTAGEIIVRDSKRLHKFVSGCCSCGDFGSLLQLFLELNW